MCAFGNITWRFFCFTMPNRIGTTGFQFYYFLHSKVRRQANGKIIPRTVHVSWFAAKTLRTLSLPYLHLNFKGCCVDTINQILNQRAQKWAKRRRNFPSQVFFWRGRWISQKTIIVVFPCFSISCQNVWLNWYCSYIKKMGYQN